MPKNRKRVSQPGAKSIPILTKFKLGTRKSGKGAKQLSDTELLEIKQRVRKRDRNMLERILTSRGLV
jgi:hypothetical protein